MRSPRITVIDVGASHVARGQFTVGAGGKLILQEFAVERLNADPALESAWNEQSSQALAAMTARGGASGPAGLVVPGHLALTKFIKTPAIEKSKRGKIIQFEASQNIPYPLEEVAWDHVVVTDDGMDLEMMLMAVKNDAMLPLCEAVQAAGQAVARALPSCLVLREAFRLNYPESNESVLLVNIGARSTHLLFHEPGRFFVRTLSLAGNTVTQTIAEELRLDFAAAEKLKVQVLSGHSELPASSPARAAVERAGENFAARLQLEITRSAVNLRRQATAAPTAAIYLAGGGAALPALPGVLREKLKLPVHTFEPLRGVDVVPAAAAARTAENIAVLPDLVGLAATLARQRGAEHEPTLLPATLGAAITEQRRRPVLLVAAALAAGALLPPIWHFHRLATAAEAEIAAIDAELRPLRSLQNRNASNLEQIETLKKQVEALHSLAQTKSNWINFFTDLQARLVKVEDVWLEKLAVVRPPLADGNRNAADAPPPLRLTLSGRLLDKNNPVSKVSEASNTRVRRLLASFRESRFIADVENERFDNSQPGLLRFDFTLVINPENPL